MPKHIAHLIGLLIAVANSQSSSAATGTDLDGLGLGGTLRDGRYIQISTSGLLVDILNKDTEESEQLFRDEPCALAFRKKADRITESVVEFSCAATGKSPLAGKRYVGHFVKGDCSGRIIGRFQYRCVSGCDTDPLVPGTLIQGYWDTGRTESECADGKTRRW